MATTHGPVPLQAPSQPANDQPGSGTGDRATAVPSSKTVEQVAPQAIPAGALATNPSPVLETESVCWLGGVPKNVFVVKTAVASGAIAVFHCWFWVGSAPPWTRPLCS